MRKIIKFSFYPLLAAVFMAVSVPNPAPGLFSNIFGDNAEIKTIIPQVVNILLGLSGMIAMLFIIVGGYQYLTSGANEGLAEKGKKTLTNAIIGLVIVILSYVVVKIVVTTLGGQ